MVNKSDAPRSTRIAQHAVTRRHHGISRRGVLAAKPHKSPALVLSCLCLRTTNSKQTQQQQQWTTVRLRPQKYRHLFLVRRRRLEFCHSHFCPANGFNAGKSSGTIYTFASSSPSPASATLSPPSTSPSTSVCCSPPVRARTESRAVVVWSPSTGLSTAAFRRRSIKHVRLRYPHTSIHVPRLVSATVSPATIIVTVLRLACPPCLPLMSLST